MEYAAVFFFLNCYKVLKWTKPWNYLHIKILLLINIEIKLMSTITDYQIASKSFYKI